MKSIATIILAAGESRRMGQAKQLLPFRESTLLEQTMNAALSARLGPVLIVLGAHAECIASRIDLHEVVVVQNERWFDGMQTSIRSGIEAVEAQVPNADAAILMNCDQPHITPELLCALAAEFKKSEPPAVGSQYDGIVGTPALFSRMHFERLKTLNSGAKSLLLELGGAVKRCDFPNGNIDVDTYADYLRLSQTGNSNE